MPAIHTRVETALASRYLEMLCRHFSRKVPSEWDARIGRVDFQPGFCEMVADADALEIRCTAETPAALDRVRFIVTDHFTRFGKKEGVSPAWSEPAEENGERSH